MKIAAVTADPERALVDYLTPVLASREPLTVVSAALPATWDPKADPPPQPYVVISWDGTPTVDYPMRAAATMRVTVWSTTPTASKSIAGVAMALLLSHPGGDGVAAIRPLTGILVARDPDNRAPIASFTVRAVLRFTVI